jgi:hypothetical protein
MGRATNRPKSEPSAEINSSRSSAGEFRIVYCPTTIFREAFSAILVYARESNFQDVILDKEAGS